MSTPKLTWGEFKDADGNWLPHLTPREVIAALEAERDALTADNALKAELLAAVTEANASYVAANDALTARLAEAERLIGAVEGDISRHLISDALRAIAAWRAAREGG
jgi:hypothetical protein